MSSLTDREAALAAMLDRGGHGPRKWHPHRRIWRRPSVRLVELEPFVPRHYPMCWHETAIVEIRGELARCVATVAGGLIRVHDLLVRLDSECRPRTRPGYAVFSPEDDGLPLEVRAYGPRPLSGRVIGVMAGRAA
jgi:hypothetical protein